MRLHLSETDPPAWACNWAESDVDTSGAVELVDPDGLIDLRHQLLYALAAALGDLAEEAGEIHREIVVCLTPAQRKQIPDVAAALRQPWPPKAHPLAARIRALNLDITTTAANAREMSWMQQASRAAIESLTIGQGGPLTLLARLS